MRVLRLLYVSVHLLYSVLHNKEAEFKLSKLRLRKVADDLRFAILRLYDVAAKRSSTLRKRRKTITYHKLCSAAATLIKNNDCTFTWIVIMKETVRTILYTLIKKLHLLMNTCLNVT